MPDLTLRRHLSSFSTLLPPKKVAEKLIKKCENTIHHNFDESENV